MVYGNGYFIVYTRYSYGLLFVYCQLVAFSLFCCIQYKICILNISKQQASFLSPFSFIQFENYSFMMDSAVSDDLHTYIVSLSIISLSWCCDPVQKSSIIFSAANLISINYLKVINVIYENVPESYCHPEPGTQWQLLHSEHFSCIKFYRIRMSLGRGRRRLKTCKN